MTAHAHRPGFDLAAALAAASFGWAATCSWRGLVVDPGRYLAPTIVAALLIAVIGAGCRSLRLRWYAVLGIQLVALLIWFHHRNTPDGPVAGWIPTPGGLADIIDHVREGASAINTAAAPVPRSFTDAPVYLIACSLLVLLLIDLIACGLRLPDWAGLPALIAVTIPISVLDDGLPTGVYLATGLLFALLLAIAEADRATSWGPVVAESPGPKASAGLPLAALAVPAVLVGTASTVLGLIISLGIPVGDGLTTDRFGGARSDDAGQITLSNPLVDLRRDLVRNDHVPLLDVKTRSRDLSYLRLTILDAFTKDSWTPSPRDLNTAHRADGALPDPPGLTPNRTGTALNWQLLTTPNFKTTWLPTPSVTRSIVTSAGDWRYDPSFLDIASADDRPPSAVRYVLFAATPKIEADDLDSAGPAPANLVRSMTALPDLPAQVKRIAEDVTETGASPYSKAVLLQDWFRSTGGFTYSLAPAPGDGVEQLARFITTDKIGYCEQYAAAMAVMARAIGIPARVVVGFLNPSDTTPDGYRYTTDDLHAWPEIYFSGSGWVRFEPTPSTRTGASPPWTRTPVERPDSSPSTGAPTTSPSKQAAPKPEPASTSSASDASTDQGGRPSLVLVFVAILALLAAPGLVRLRQRHLRWRRTSDPAADLERLWLELGATAVDLGTPWPAGQSPRMTAAHLAAWASSAESAVINGINDEDRAALDLLVTLIEQIRYGAPATISASDHEQAHAAARRWKAVLQSAVTSRQNWLARLAPRSVLVRRRTNPAWSTGQSDEAADSIRERV